MIEATITASVLILIITTLRYLLRGKISSRLQYALWALVAVRLLLPFSLFESPVSVMNAIPEVQSGYSATAQTAAPVNHGNTMLPSENSPALQNSPAKSNGSPGRTNTIDGIKIVQYIWLSGLILSGGFLAASNIRLSKKLKKNRKQVEIPQCPLTVYLVSGLSSPCLYGIVRPAVYITPESLSDEKRTEYVLAHELTHYHHKDHIWSFARVLCLCIHWFNPLVWLAAMLSRQDSELASDEGTLLRIGSENRAEYGRTLIEMMTAPSKSSDIFCCATTMTGCKGEMTERIKRIAKQPKTLMLTLAIVVVTIVAAVALTFGGTASKVPIVQLQGGEVTGITIEQINRGKRLGAIKISQKADMEAILNALADTNKTFQESVNDAPNRDDYYQIDIAGSVTRRFYLYNNGERYFIEEPYVGIYRTNRGTSVAIAKIYTANGGIFLIVQELWNARTAYVGNNSAVGKLIMMLPLPTGLQHDSFALRTSGNERGLEWYLKGDESESYEAQMFDLNALLLFALIDNLEDFYVNVEYPSGKIINHQYYRGWADETVNGDIRDYAKSPEKLHELIDSHAVETPSYSIEKLKNGKVISKYPLENPDLADAIILDYMVKSAAWKGVDISTLKECFLIRQTFPKANEIHDYYAYLLKDGTAVLQSGKDGWYSVLSQELYLELINTWDTLTADPWRETIYTEGVPRPNFDNMLWMTEDKEEGYSVVSYQDVNQEQIEDYLQTLVDDGWQTISNFNENPTVGGIYEKGSNEIKIQLAGEQVVIYFLLK